MLNSFLITKRTIKIRRLTFWTRKHPKARQSLTVLSEKKKNAIQQKEKAQNSKTVGDSRIKKLCFGETTEEKVKINVNGYSIEEDKNWKIAANIGAVFVLTVCAFLYGYFA